MRMSRRSCLKGLLAGSLGMLAFMHPKHRGKHTDERSKPNARFPSKAYMVWYLMAAYNPQLGLFEASPNIEAGTYFVHGDAYLAGANISQYDVPKIPHYTVLREGLIVPETEICYGLDCIDLAENIQTHIPNPGVILNLTDWADRTLLAALSARHAGNDARAEELIAVARGMWTGQGLEDEFYRWHEQAHGFGAFETFKTALFYRMTGDLEALRILREMQEEEFASEHFGGIYNMYDANGERFPWIDSNVETTAIVLLCA